MSTERWVASAVSHQSVMIVMGDQDENHILSDVKLLDSTTGQWFKCNDLPKPLYFLYSVRVDTYQEGHLQMARTITECLPLLRCFVYLSTAVTPFIGSTGISLNNKYLIIVGGAASCDTVCVLKREERLMSWESFGSVPNLRHTYMGASTSAVSLDNQIILIGGGIVNAKTVTVGKFQ